LSPFRFQWREMIFISWVGLRGAVSIFLASIPLLVGQSRAHIYFDITFVVVLTSLLIQGWTVGLAARKLYIALPRFNRLSRVIEAGLSEQLEKEIIGYPVLAKSLYLKIGLLPSGVGPAFVVRDGNILVPSDAQPAQVGDYVYLFASPGKGWELSRFFGKVSPLQDPDSRLLGEFFVAGNVKLGALSDFYGLSIAPTDAGTSLAEHIAKWLEGEPRRGDYVLLGPIALVVHSVANGSVATVGLRFGDEGQMPPVPDRRKSSDLWTWFGKIRRIYQYR
jgi:potassium/hydrogen antiporter